MRTAVLFTFLICAGGSLAFGDDSVVQDLLPRPQQIEVRDGVFKFQPGRLRFSLAATTPEANARLSGLLEEIQLRLGMATKVKARTGDGFSLVVASRAVESPKADPLPEQIGDEGYELVVAPSGAVIRARAEQGLLHGMLTLEQMLSAALVRGRHRVPCLRIVDWPALPMRGFHEDYGRDQLPTAEDHERSVRTLAQFKMNTYLWFIEPDHFVYKFDPELSTEYDRFRFDEVRAMAAYARQHYIEVIPVVELLGHMEMTLRHERYKDLAELPEGGGDLCATSDAAFDLVRNIVNEVAPAFAGRYFHCGLDESYAVGKGRSADAAKEKGIEQVFADYYTRMDNLVKSHGQTMVMYADIVLNHPAMLSLLPKDIVMMFWDYAPRQRYPDLDTLAQSGCPVMALSGLWDWNNLYPRYPAAFKNMETLCAQASQAGALGHFVSSWGDGYRGAAGVNLSELNVFGFVYCAALSWNPAPLSLEDYSGAFALQFFADASPELAAALTRMARCQGDDLAFNCQPKFIFHGEAADSIVAMKNADEAALSFWRTLKTETEAAHTALVAAHPSRNGDYLRSIDLAARMLTLSADLALAYRDVAVLAEGASFDAAETANRFDKLAERHRALWDEYQAVWTATNRPLNLKHIGRVWTATADSISKLAADIRAGALPAPEKKK